MDVREAAEHTITGAMILIVLYILGSLLYDKNGRYVVLIVSALLLAAFLVGWLVRSWWEVLQ